MINSSNFVFPRVFLGDQYVYKFSKIGKLRGISPDQEKASRIVKNIFQIDSRDSGRGDESAGIIIGGEKLLRPHYVKYLAFFCFSCPDFPQMPWKIWLLWMKRLG